MTNTSGKVEAVARGICRAMGNDPDKPWNEAAAPHIVRTANTPKSVLLWELYVPSAKAAIEAMREPTDAMWNAAHAWGCDMNEVSDAWPVMIDAALEEGE